MTVRATSAELGRVLGRLRPVVAGAGEEAASGVARFVVGEPPAGSVALPWRALVRRDDVSVGCRAGPGQITGGPHDGWYATGDLFRRGDGEELWFVARTKDVI